MSAFYERSNRVVVVLFTSAMFGLGFATFMTLSLTGFDLTRSATVWGSYLNHLAGAMPADQVKATAPFLGVFAVATIAAALTQFNATRRRAKEQSNG